MGLIMCCTASTGPWPVRLASPSVAPAGRPPATTPANKQAIARLRPCPHLGLHHTHALQPLARSSKQDLRSAPGEVTLLPPLDPGDAVRKAPGGPRLQPVDAAEDAVVQERVRQREERLAARRKRLDVGVCVEGGAGCVWWWWWWGGVGWGGGVCLCPCGEKWVVQAGQGKGH